MKNKPPGASPLTLLRTGKAASSALTFPVWQWKQREPDLRPCMGGRDGDKPQTGLPAQKVMNLKAREGKENLRAKVPQHHPHPVFKKKKGSWILKLSGEARERKKRGKGSNLGLGSILSGITKRCAQNNGIPHASFLLSSSRVPWV